VPWDISTIGALIALVVIWAAWFIGTWGNWGNLTADCGREMYVPAVLAEGRTLYRDVWYNFGPAAPYFNSVLYRIFGVNLTTLYWAGSLSALGSAIFLFFVGKRLASPLAGWTAAAVLLCEAFHPSLFSFPLPYSFPAAYGCLITCLLLWLVVGALESAHWAWLAGAGWATAAATLLKPEFGASCAIGILLLIAARAIQRQSSKTIVKDLLLLLPAAIAGAAGIVWMISLKGVEFITQENLQSWPTSYFMRTYGKLWLAFTGFSLTSAALSESALRIFVFVSFFQGIVLFANWRRTARTPVALRVVLFLGALGYVIWHVSWKDALRWLFFPQDMVAFAIAGAVVAWWHFLRGRPQERNPAVPLVLSISALTAIRILFGMLPWSYPIFYNGPIVLSFFLLLGAFFPPIQSSRLSRWSLVLPVAALAVTLLNSRRADTPSLEVVPLVTDRGTIKVTPSRAENYRSAINFMRAKNALGEYVLSVPEDTSLYFLSGTHSPSRVFAFTPGIVAPGKMTDELVHEIESKNVRYLIWSNRIFWEYGVPRFGTDFDKTFGDYLTSHYQRVGPLSDKPVRLGEWNAYIWEQKSENAARE
jgi:hypothetical protein